MNNTFVLVATSTKVLARALASIKYYSLFVILYSLIS